MDHCTWSHGDLACGRRDAAAFEAIDQGDDLSWRFNPPGPTGMSGLWCLGKPQPMDQAPRKCYQIIQIYPSPRLSSSSPPHPWDCGSAEDTTAAGQLARTSHSTSLCWWVEVWTLEKWWKCESIGKILPARTENPTWFERPQPISWKHVQMKTCPNARPEAAKTALSLTRSWGKDDVQQLGGLEIDGNYWVWPSLDGVMVIMRMSWDN